jgi:Transglycosylase-like domain/Putative peptidoglycan binding domain
MPAPCPDAVRRPRRRVLAALLLVAACGAVLAAPASAHAAVLKRGSRGPEVVQLQQKLHLAADGVFGPDTERAVRRYQSHEGLTVDGVVGPQTAAALGLGPIRGASARHRARIVRLPAILARIARCESGGDPHAISPGGTYRGKYQFDRQTWRAIGGSGDPARASEAAQDRLALKLLHERGTSPWPACG